MVSRWLIVLPGNLEGRNSIGLVEFSILNILGIDDYPMLLYDLDNIAVTLYMCLCMCRSVCIYIYLQSAVNRERKYLVKYNTSKAILISFLHIAPLICISMSDGNLEERKSLRLLVPRCTLK